MADCPEKPNKEKVFKAQERYCCWFKMADDPVVMAALALIVFAPMLFILTWLMFQQGGTLSYLAILPFSLALYAVYDKVGKLIIKKGK